MVKVIVKDGQNLEEALKVFKRKIQRDKVIQDYKANQRYEKRSDRKRREKKERKKVARKIQRLMQSS